MSVTLEQQFELERQMMDGGIERFRASTNKSVEKGVESRTLHGRTIIAHAVANVAEGVDEIKKGKSNRDIAKKKLKDMPSDVVAYLALTSSVDFISKNTALLSIGYKIGTAIEMQDRLHRWVQAEGKTALNVIALANEKGASSKAVGLIHKMNKDGYSELAWAKEERMHVGLRLVDAIIIKTGIIKLNTFSTGSNKTTTYAEPTEKTREWIKAFNHTAETWKPKALPCIVPPKDWTDIVGGGFHSPYIEPLSILRRRK